MTDLNSEPAAWWVSYYLRRDPEPWREPLGALRLTLAGDASRVDVKRAQHEVEVLVRTLNECAAPADIYCREENCEYRHWRSGLMPTHQRGSTCPPVSSVAS